jgi:ribosomal protein S18 acetylase RimI-like enzyme
MVTRINSAVTMTDSAEALTFRQATEVDIPFLLELRRRTMSEHLRASGVEPSESERRERVLASFDCAEIILLAGAPVGLLKVVKSPDDWHLSQIQILPEKQGRGLGSSIIKKLLADAVQARATVSLSVLGANPARQLYERLGFRVVRQNERAYDMKFGG